MSHLQLISDLPEDNIKKIIDSINYVLFDIDGTLIYNKELIPGAAEAIAKLRQLKKKIAFVSNNAFYPTDVFVANLKPFNATDDEVVLPIAALLGYLKKIGFDKDIYVICCELPKKMLRDAGYNVIDYENISSYKMEENIQAISELSFKTLEVCKNVGAVLVDFDMNTCYGAIQAAKIILNHLNDVILLTGPNDDLGSIGSNINAIGPRFIIDGLERWTNKKSVIIAKPGLPLKDVITSKYNISDDNRVLFVGDNANVDIAFGVNCGYQTLLVLSGVTTRSQVENWNFPENYKPTYVAENLGELYEKIRDL